jgi:hypothetical protein
MHPNKHLPILNSEISIVPSELETTLPVEFLEKGSLSSYPIIIAKVFDSVFELGNVNVKLKVLNNYHNR